MILYRLYKDCFARKKVYYSIKGKNINDLCTKHFKGEVI